MPVFLVNWFNIALITLRLMLLGIAPGQIDINVHSACGPGLQLWSFYNISTSQGPALLAVDNTSQSASLLADQPIHSQPASLVCTEADGADKIVQVAEDKHILLLIYENGLQYVFEFRPREFRGGGNLQ